MRSAGSTLKPPPGLRKTEIFLRLASFIVQDQDIS